MNYSDMTKTQLKAEIGNYKSLLRRILEITSQKHIEELRNNGYEVAPYAYALGEVEGTIKGYFPVYGGDE